MLALLQYKRWSILPGQGMAMLIGELAQKIGLSADTIRFYEKKGLIDATHIKRRDNNYKEYSELVIDRLILIKQAKRLGFTLAEIHQLIGDWETNQLTIEEKENIFRQKIELIDERISELQLVKTYLLEKIDFLQK